MIKTNTYIVINSTLVQKLKHIEAFKMNLGLSLIDKKNSFMPADINIQKHVIFHNSIINLVGYIGALPVYTATNSDTSAIMLYNEKESLKYAIDDTMSMYDNINVALDLFFTKIGIKKNVVTTPDKKLEPAEYVQPTKKLSDMTELERIDFARNRK